MSDKTFREQVEGTISDLLQELGFDNELPKTKKRYTARILVAHDREMERIAKGLPEVRKDSQWSYIAKEQHLADQDHILAERAGK